MNEHLSKTTGFRGFSTSDTDVDAAIAEANRIAAAPPLDPAPSDGGSEAARSQPIDHDRGAVIRPLKTAGKWAVAAILIFLFKVLSNGDVPWAVPTRSPQPSSTADAVLLNGDGGTTAVAAGADTPAASEAGDSHAASLDEDGTTSAKPSAGSAPLTVAELRYCLAEDVRVAAEKRELDSLQFSDSARFNRNVDAFNEVVSDYNSRCSSRMALSADRRVAESQVERQRPTLQEEGQSRVD